jgi:predicted transcriptional regulator
MSGMSVSLPESCKSHALAAIAAMPDDVTYADIQHELFVIQKVREGMKAAREGRTTPHEVVMVEFNR